MPESDHIANREFHSFKEGILTRASNFEVEPNAFKKRVAENCGLTIQMVRKWFREENLYRKTIEKAAFEELDKAKVEYLIREEKRKSNLKKAAS